MLEGLKVIEMATYIAAPAAGGLFADWGADVIKIEPLSGCPMRHFYASALTDDYPDNPVFDLDNRGKRGLAINTSSVEGADLVRRLAQDADVFVTNVRPTQLKRQGLDYPSLRELNGGRLVYGSVTGFGLEGDECDKPGFDTVGFWARSGVGWMMTPKETTPAPLRVALGDHVTGLATAAGILAAVLRARSSGKGSLVESSLLRSGAYSIGSDFSTWLRYGRIARSRPREAPIVPANNFYKTKDDHWVFVNARPNEPDWPQFLRALKQEQLEHDERFKSPHLRRKNALALVAIIDGVFAEATLAEWKTRLDAEDIIWSAVQNFEQAANDPQMQAAGVFVDMPKRDGETYKAPASPIRFDTDDSGPRGVAPELGEHTHTVIETLGVSEQERNELVAKGVINAPVSQEV